MLSLKSSKAFAFLFLFLTSHAIGIQALAQWDNVIAYRNVYAENAMAYVVNQNGFSRVNEGRISYWNAGSSGGKLTQKFSFPANVASANLRMNYIYSWGGSGSLWASKNGTQWTQLLNAPSAGIPVGYAYTNNLPTEVLGGKEIWIEARHISGLWQYLRYDLDRSDNAFELKVKYESTPTAPPVIVFQPQPQSFTVGNDATFCVTLKDAGTYNYQWQRNEQNIAGATLNCYTINSVTAAMDGSRYRVIVSNSAGTIISDNATLSVVTPPPPTIVTQPISQTVAEGTVQVFLSVTATGTGSLNYQWQINNQNIPGATASTLTLTGVRTSANGIYRVIVTSQYGSTISTEAVLSIVVFDSDNDGLSDYEELLLGTNANKADTDGDGLSDFAEVRTHKSNPLTTDTDGDGYSDGIEVARDGNPNNRSVTPTGALAIFPAVDVEFYTLSGVKYQLEVSTDMVSWSAQGGVVVGTGGSQNHLVRASKATQFWRLKVVQ